MPDTRLPLRHVSIRVPWHDSGWMGTICRAPHLNEACTKLQRIADGKREAAEVSLAGRSLEELPVEQWPCCIEERATFMAPFAMDQVKRHALAQKNPQHYGHFKPTRQRYPPYSAGIVPFRWLMREEMDSHAERAGIAVDASREPELGYKSNWVHEASNQQALLDAFAAHLRESDSLCLFYAKHVPFVEGTGRILVGVGRVRALSPVTEYERSGQGMRGMIWERPLQHSIRPKEKDGFLLPYAAILERAAADSSLDLAPLVAHAPGEHWDEFSYGSELVTHDGAIGALLAIDAALSRTEAVLGIETGWERQWICTELVRLWKVRGPYPGLGAVLTAFGLSRGPFVAHALQEAVGENADPWPQVDAWFDKATSAVPAELRRDHKELAPTWKRLPARRRAFLRLLSRFELTAEQAASLYEAESRQRHGWQVKDDEILDNPYRLYEATRHDPNAMSLLTVDRGVFPDDAVRLKHPLDPPSALESAVDIRRARAFATFVLERAADAGHTLLPIGRLVEDVVGLDVKPPCPLTGDVVRARLPELSPELLAVSDSDPEAVQLARYHDIGQVVRQQIEGRILRGKRHQLKKDWSSLVAQRFGAASDLEEARAFEEKAAALRELAESRLTAFIGPAGAGKTSVLGILCEQPEIRDAGLLLLAPTGKARVRMQQLVGTGSGRALTIAQFLNQNGRYDGASGRYHLSPQKPKATGFDTVIVDEASMLTEDMLGALFDAIEGVKRFILVGDPSQLPPIGAGRPFVDVVSRLRPVDHERLFPRVAAGYAELTIERRQVGADRPDLRLGRWFSGSSPTPGEDEAFIVGGASDHIRLVEWQTADDFQAKLAQVLAEELRLAGPDDVRGFNRTLGCTQTDSYDYFNASRKGQEGAVRAIEEWQVLSPLRGMPWGVGDVNRRIHERYRSGFLKLASQQWRSIPKPMGPERIVYGDKVINTSNHRRDGRRVYPAEGAIGYLANGEMGIVTGQWKSRANPRILKVEFSSQPGYTYDFYGSDFGEEGEAALELAYALTVHKAQGSQFRLVILVVPVAHPILSRELLYTALTRHQDRVVVMHQGPWARLRDLAAPHRSESARRMTNLLRPCRMVEVPLPRGSVFLQDGLVHRTSTGVAVRSKSELVIAEALAHAGVRFHYERPLTLGGLTRYPDFTVEDDVSGRTVFWEHLGLLERDSYRRSWERKLEWYRDHGVLPEAEGEGAEGTLVTTEESSKGGFDAAIVQATIRRQFGAGAPPGNAR